MRAPPRSTLLDLGGLLLVMWGTYATLLRLDEPIVPYDEGIFLTNAALILEGAAPYRDFYTNYPPGIFLLLAAAWKICGVYGWVPQLLGLAMHFLLAAIAGRLAGVMAGRSFSLLCAGLVLLWLVPLGAVPYAWLAALGAALLALELFRFAVRGKSNAHFFWPGLMLGVVGCFRHDLFAYSAGAAALAVGIVSVRSRMLLDSRFWKRAVWLTGGAVVPLAVVWGPALVTAGLQRILADIYLDQVKHVMPARVTPFPPFFTLERVTRFDLPLPALLREPFAAAVALAFLGPVVALVMLCLRRRLAHFDRVALWGAGVLTLAVLPYLYGRTDLPHAALALTPSLVLSAALAEMCWSRIKPWWGIPLALAIVGLCLFPIRKTPRALADWPRIDWFSEEEKRWRGLNLGEPQRATIHFITQNTGRDEGIFSGNIQHRRVIQNDISLYYLSGRRGVTRYMQFDPNIVTRADVQQRMIEDLERKRVRIVILREGGWHEEPNQSRAFGASMLDEYLQEHYEPAGGSEPYFWFRRKAD